MFIINDFIKITVTIEILFKLWYNNVIKYWEVIVEYSQEMKSFFYKNSPTLTDIELGQILNGNSLFNKGFVEASKLGIEYAKNNGFSEIEDAPFCIDKVSSSSENVILSPDAVDVVDEAQRLARVESDTEKMTFRSHVEVAFALVGYQTEKGIFIDEAFYDYASYGSLSRRYNLAASNNLELSVGFMNKLCEACKNIDTSKGQRVVIYGHTHPQISPFWKVNNYPSRVDIASSIGEAYMHYEQNGGNCIFLNAIATADKDINIYGLNLTTGKYQIYPNVKNIYGDKIKSYTVGNYPLSEKSQKQPGEM